MLESGEEHHQWPASGRVGYLTPAISGVPNAKSGGQRQEWPTIGRIAYTTPAVWGIPNTSKRGTTSGVAHNWADCLHNPCHLGAPQCGRAGRENQKCRTSGRIGYTTPTF